jgi:hypothetical protein
VQHLGLLGVGREEGVEDGVEGLEGGLVARLVVAVHEDGNNLADFLDGEFLVAGH